MGRRRFSLLGGGVSCPPLFFSLRSVPGVSGWWRPVIFLWWLRLWLLCVVFPWPSRPRLLFGFWLPWFLGWSCVGLAFALLVVDPVVFAGAVVSFLVLAVRLPRR